METLQVRGDIAGNHWFPSPKRSSRRLSPPLSGLGATVQTYPRAAQFQGARISSYRTCFETALGTEDVHCTELVTFPTFRGAEREFITSNFPIPGFTHAIVGLCWSGHGRRISSGGDGKRDLRGSAANYVENALSAETIQSLLA